MVKAISINQVEVKTQSEEGLFAGLLGNKNSAIFGLGHFRYYSRD